MVSTSRMNAAPDDFPLGTAILAKKHEQDGA
jgi:hypothetical protein